MVVAVRRCFVKTTRTDNSSQCPKMIYRPFKPHDPIPVEQTFDRLIESTGGSRVSALVGSSPEFANADYVFSDDQIVVELKELRTDWPQLKDFQQKISDLWLRCELAGRVSEVHATGQMPIPRDVRREFLQLLRKPIKRVLEKANRQIRETHKSLHHEAGQGVVLLVIDGLLTVAPEFLMALVSKILVHDYSSINGIVLITVNEYVDAPGDEYARLLWWPNYQESVPDSLVDFVDNLGRAWFNLIESEVGGFDDRSEGPDRSWTEGAHFVRRP